MAVGAGTRSQLNTLLGSAAAADLVNQIDSGGNPVAANVALLGETSDLSAAATTAGGTPDVEAGAVDDAIDALSAEVEARLDDIEAKVDAVISAMIAAGQMAAA